MNVYTNLLLRRNRYYEIQYFNSIIKIYIASIDKKFKLKTNVRKK